MRATTFVSTAVLTAMIAACAGGSAGPAPATAPAPAATIVMQQAAKAEAPQPKEIDLTGDYVVSIAYGGQPIDLTLSLGKKDDGTMGGSIYVEQAGTIPFGDMTVDGKRVKASLTSPDGSAVTMDFTIEGAELTGTWSSSNGDGSAMRGRKQQ